MPDQDRVKSATSALRPELTEVYPRVAEALRLTDMLDEASAGGDAGRVNKTEAEVRRVLEPEGCGIPPLPEGDGPATAGVKP